MPTLAILNFELRGLMSSWLVRSWFVAAVLATLLVTAGAWQQADPAVLIAMLLGSFSVLPWCLAVIMLGIEPTTGSRLDALADGILCRPITRYEYLVGSWAARVVTVLSVYLVIMFPTIMLVMFSRGAATDRPVTLYGALSALAVVALVLTFLVTLSYLAGTVLRRPLLAAVIMIIFWLPINAILHNFSLEEFSPISLTQALPTLLRTPWEQRAEEADSELAAEDVEALMRQGQAFLSALSGGPAAAPPKKENFFDRGDYHDFSLLRVSLGYGVPTLLALLLAGSIFCWRDL